MWCEAIVRNAAEHGDLAGRKLDYVDIRWDQRRSTFRGRSRDGEEVRVLLPRGQILRHGDVLFEDSAQALLVNVLPCELIVVRSDNTCLVAELALELGNLHWPTQVTEEEILFPESEDALAAARHLGLNWTTETRRFEPLEIASATVSGSPAIRILRSGDTRVDQ